MGTPELVNFVRKKLGSIHVRTLIFVVCTTVLVYFGKTLYFDREGRQIEPYVKNQWHNFYLFSSPFDSYEVPLILFDVEILPHVFKPRREVWHDPAYTCRVLCKHHPDGNNLITFAVLARNFIPQKDKLLARLEKLRFAFHLSEVKDPRLHDAEQLTKVPTYLWLARNDHVIHITILHDRHGDYYWAGPVTDTDWTDTVRALKPQMKKDWRTLNGAVFPRYAQAYEKSHHLTGIGTKIDSHKFIVPYNIKGFLKEYQRARFIECDHKRAQKFRETYPSHETPEEIAFQVRAKKLLGLAKKVLTKLEIPFWLSSGTLLGWYRQCGIIGHSVDVDIAIWIHNYQEDVIEIMEKNGLTLKNIFGRIEDSYEISFVDSNDVKLDIFFFYEEVDYAWNGGTRAHDGAKFKYTYPKFSLCWTEFLEMKFRVPCETTSFIEANYGKQWNKPTKHWVWYSSPPNVVPNGFWDRKQWDEVIQVYEKNEEGVKDDGDL